MHESMFSMYISGLRFFPRKGALNSGRGSNTNEVMVERVEKGWGRSCDININGGRSEGRIRSVLYGAGVC